MQQNHSLFLATEISLLDFKIPLSHDKMWFSVFLNEIVLICHRLGRTIGFCYKQLRYVHRCLGHSESSKSCLPTSPKAMVMPRKMEEMCHDDLLLAICLRSWSISISWSSALQHLYRHPNTKPAPMIGFACILSCTLSINLSSACLLSPGSSNSRMSSCQHLSPFSSKNGFNSLHQDTHKLSAKFTLKYQSISNWWSRISDVASKIVGMEKERSGSLHLQGGP